MPRAIYVNQGAEQVESFFDNVQAEIKEKGGATFDSAVSASVLKSETPLPESLQQVLGVLKNEEDQIRVMDAVSYGISAYQREHGVAPTADVLMAALDQGFNAAHEFDGKTGRWTLDGVSTTLHHDQISMQPNRIVVAITSAIAEAVPFATYLPTDIGSNEARLGIISHIAGSAFGGYTASEGMDGVNVGKPYLSAERRIPLTLDGTRANATGTFTTVIGGGTGVKVLRGRTLVFVNGFHVASEAHNSNSGPATSPIAGAVVLGGTTHNISGTVNVDTGAVALTFSPVLPAGTLVDAEGFIDYEKQPELAPELVTQVDTFQLFATPWRATARQTIDSRTQSNNELGLDLQSETLISIRNQFAMERHYSALNKLARLANNSQFTFNFDWTAQKTDKTRAKIWQDFTAVLGVADQQMAENTMDTGITHLYVQQNVAAQWMALPRDLFEPSGLVARPGIYRIGRLFGRFEVYYTPSGKISGMSDSASASTILAIGRSNQVARCPIVMGDAVAPTYLPLAMQADLRYGNGFYARNFTSVNPHMPSARSAALINVTNMN